MGEDKIFIVFREPAFGERRVEIVLPNQEMAIKYIETRDLYGYGGWRYEEHEIKYEF